MLMPIRSFVCGVLLAASSMASAMAQGTHLLRHPTVSHDMVAFEYGGDLWVVSHPVHRVPRPAPIDRVTVSSQ
jgi:hypothetical protein